MSETVWEDSLSSRFGRYLPAFSVGMITESFISMPLGGFTRKNRNRRRVYDSAAFAW